MFVFIQFVHSYTVHSFCYLFFPFYGIRCAFAHADTHMKLCVGSFWLSRWWWLWYKTLLHRTYQIYVCCASTTIVHTLCMRLCACVSKVLIQCSRYHTKQFYTIEYEENNNVFSGFIRMVALSLPVPRRRLQFFVCPRQIEKKKCCKKSTFGWPKKKLYLSTGYR